MELEEMKSVWHEVSRDLDSQKQLTNELITEMAHRKSSSRLKRIIYAESIGSLVSLAMACYLLWYLNDFNYQVSFYTGLGLAVVFLLSVVLGLRIVFQAKRIDIAALSYIKVLNNFNDLRATLRTYKRVSQVLYVVIPFLVIPVFYDLFLGKNILDEPMRLVKTLMICVIVLPLIWWLIAKFYKSNMRRVSSAIKDYRKTENEN